MNFISYNQFIKDIKNFCDKLPRDFDMVIGVPRSGIIPAAMIALYLNIPLSTPETLKSMGGQRVNKEKSVNNVLLIEDSCQSGSSLQNILLKLKREPFKVKTAAVYVRRDNKCRKLVDYWWKEVPIPRIYEWNIFHHNVLNQCCLDFDGVLCRDPTPYENDEGQKYAKFLRTAEPRYVPTQKIGWIVTARLEKWRDLSEKWLKWHNVEYGELVMMNLPDAAARAEYGIAKFKAEFYEKCGAELFVESEEWQAKQIAELSGKEVLSVETMKIIGNKL